MKPFVSNRAQQRAVLLGKIIRIDPLKPTGDCRTASRPTTPTSAAGVRPEIYFYGLRNPCRFSFDPRRPATC